MNKVFITIQYAGLVLQIAKNDKGEDCTPLKPISDLFGLRWDRQFQKVNDSDHLRKFLGVCTLHMWGADGQKREQTCILLSRVAAFLMSISPDRVRTNGNVGGAEFLEQKISEWADALHDYEELGYAINMNHAKSQELLRKQRMALFQMINMKNKTESQPDRNAMAHIIKQAAGELNVPYMPDLFDGT
jgi:hypothetical protein